MPKKVLCADDDDSVRTSYKFILDRYDVVLVKNGQEALEKIEELGFGEGGIGLILTDINMGPGINGIDVITAMLDKGYHIPTYVIATPIGEQEHQLKELTKAYSHIFHLEKPLDVHKLQGIVEREFQKYS